MVTNVISRLFFLALLKSSPSQFITVQYGKYLRPFVVVHIFDLHWGGGGGGGGGGGKQMRMGLLLRLLGWSVVHVSAVHTKCHFQTSVLSDLVPCLNSLQCSMENTLGLPGHCIGGGGGGGGGGIPLSFIPGTASFMVWNAAVRLIAIS